jgi:uncharacterized membrane protein YedE/YeeE
VRRAAAVVFGIAFGFWLAWTHMTDFDQIVGALLFHHAYLWLMFATGVATTVVGLRVLRWTGASTLVGRKPIDWPSVRPQRRHVVGSVLFGIGWALAGACPGPIVAQLGLGRLSSLLTLVGLFAGIRLADAASRRTSPAAAPSSCAGETSEGLV